MSRIYKTERSSVSRIFTVAAGRYAAALGISRDQFLTLVSVEEVPDVDEAAELLNSIRAHVAGHFKAKTVEQLDGLSVERLTYALAMAWLDLTSVRMKGILADAKRTGGNEYKVAASTEPGPSDEK